jgi:F420H(2)-dependent quinone reductase
LLTRGRTTFSSLIAGLPVVMLTTTGARSGLQRTLPLLGIPQDDSVVVIASNFGRSRDPGWYHNLRANPQAIEIYPGWRQYRERAAHRRIPIIELKAVER